MLPGFEDYAYELNDFEREMALPVFLSRLQNCKGKAKSVTSDELIAEFNGAVPSRKMAGARVRKIINYIRGKGLIPGLIASSAGYWIETDPREVRRYIDSLEGRENEIRRIRMKMEAYRDTLITSKTE